MSARRRCSIAPAERLRWRSAWRTSFRGSGGGRAILGFWYHFAIMFEALFILTVIDAGTRVGRFMLQDLLGHVWKPLGRTSWMPGVICHQRGDRSCLGIFSVSGSSRSAGRNQLALAALRHRESAAGGRSRSAWRRRSWSKCIGASYMWITWSALWLLIVTFTAAYAEDLRRRARIGFLAQADQLRELARQVAAAKVAATQILIFNARLDAVVCGIFLVLVTIILLDSLRVWAGILRGTRETTVASRPSC